MPATWCALSYSPNLRRQSTLISLLQTSAQGDYLAPGPRASEERSGGCNAGRVDFQARAHNHPHLPTFEGVMPRCSPCWSVPYWSLWPLRSSPFPSVPLPQCFCHTQFLTFHTMACTSPCLLCLVNSYLSFKAQVKCHLSWTTFLLLKQP